jgi:putative tricarboxylic transport membrane protein
MKRLPILLILVLACTLVAAPAAAQPAWTPDHSVELIVGTSAGGGQDRTARTIQKLLQEKKLIDVAMSVNNRPGGGGAVALAYSHQHPGDGHFLQVASPTLLTNHISGKSQYNWSDFSPLSILFSEAIVFAVKAGSPIKTGADLIAMLKKDPAAVAISTSTAAGNQYHIASVLVGRAAGVPPAKLKVVIFNSGADAITALLGGHVQVTTASASNFIGHVTAGTLRVIAVSAPHRLAGALANVPIWKEFGVDLTLDQWRLVFGPPRLSAAQVAYWDGVLSRLVKTEEWRDELQRNLWDDIYKGPAETRKFLAAEYSDTRAILTEIGLAKGK